MAGSLFLWIPSESLTVLLLQLYNDAFLSFSSIALDLHCCKERKVRHSVYTTFTTSQILPQIKAGSFRYHVVSAIPLEEGEKGGKIPA